MTKILIIRFRRIGDSVISSTLCTSLKKSIPNAEIHYILNENISSLYKYHPDIDKIISFSNHDMSSFSKYLKKVYSVMKSEKYGIIIDTRSTVKTLFFSLFSLKTPFRIGRQKWYNRLIHSHRINNVYNGTGDNAQITLDLLNPLTKKYNITKDPHFKLYYSDNEINNFNRYMSEKGINFEKPIIICGVVARLQHKNWDKGKMKTILERIIDKYDAQLIFNFGDEIEKKVALELHSLMDNNAQVFTNIEASNLRELICLLANSNFFFGIEGGTRHISQALDIPSFAIYPPGIVKDNWLPNQSERFQGIELKDIVSNKTICQNLTFEEQYNLFDLESVWSRLDSSLKYNLSKTKTI